MEAPKKRFGAQDWLNEHRFVAVMSNLIIYALVSGGVFGWIEVRKEQSDDFAKKNYCATCAGG